MQITLDRHNLRLNLNDDLLPDPPHFSLPSTFKKRGGKKRKLEGESVEIDDDGGRKRKTGGFGRKNKRTEASGKVKERRGKRLETETIEIPERLERREGRD